MTGSATTTREEKRARTEHRISVEAKRLTDERGFDGWTLEDLASRVDVSRRTLFNYFPSKLDAVLGATPELPADDLATFVAGGPHGHLVDDLAELAVALLSTKDLSRDELELGQRVFWDNPRLLSAAHERFEVMTTDFAALILRREGPAYGEAQALLLVRLLVAIFDCCLPNPTRPAQDLPVDPDRPLAEVFAETLRAARRLLA